MLGWQLAVRKSRFFVAFYVGDDEAIQRGGKERVTLRTGAVDQKVLMTQTLRVD